MLLSTGGVSISKHYSGSELYSVSVTGHAESCCAEKCDCCQETYEYLKIKDKFVATDFDFQPEKNIQFVIPFFIILNFEICEFTYLTKFHFYEINPPPNNQDIILKTSSFLC